MDIKLITLSNYVRPPLVENKSRNWVLNGRNNEFYQYIIDRHNGSPTNSSINNSYIDLIYGRGLDYKNGIKGVNDWAKFQTILRPKELRKIISDFQIFGEFSFQTVDTKGGELHSITHVSKQNVVPSIANEENEIENYWFSRDWTKLGQNKPVEIPAFGTSGKGSKMFVGKPYKVGKIYFSDPDYLAGLPYAEMEEEIANLNINSIKQGLSAGYMINIPDGKSWADEDKESFERKIKEKLTGSPNASNFILSFNGRDVEITVTPFPVNENIHKQWAFLTEEAKMQILTSHRATSPSLVGLVSSSGFSNTADEMDMAEIQLYKRVIHPKQEFVLDALQEVLVSYGINLDLYFKPLTEPVENTLDVSREVSKTTDNGTSIDVVAQDDETLKAQAGLRGSVGGVQGVLSIQAAVKDGTTDRASALTILEEVYGFSPEVARGLLGDVSEDPFAMSNHVCMSDDDGATEDMANTLIQFGEDESDEWDLLCSSDVDYETDDDLFGLVKFATSTGTARPNAKSEQDSEDIKIRYRYVGNPFPERGFCQKMMFANKLYRKEDILQMEKSGVNDGFGLGGSNSYSIWLWKGGGKISTAFPNGTCKHKWQREIYLKRGGGVDVNSPLAKTISTSEARRKGYKVPVNNPNVGLTPNKNVL